MNPIDPIISIDSVKVWYNGILSEPQLNHPECVAIDQKGNVWCGGERGEIFRIRADGSKIEQVCSTGGFVLGIAFDDRERLYICDMKYAKVFVYDTVTGDLQALTNDETEKKLINPNYPIVDEQRQVLYVSDSNTRGQIAPGIWRFDLQSGHGTLWYKLPMNFANGLALSKDGHTLYIAETFAKQITKISIDEFGNPGVAETFINLDALPDGLVLDDDGYLYVCCYEPSQVYRVSTNQGSNRNVELLVHDPTAEILCHPTNGAFRGSTLFLANLGRWHISAVDLDRK